MNRWPLVITLAAACQTAPAASSAHATGEGPASPATPALPRGHVTVDAKTGPSVFDVELALDPPAHERGLMFRKVVPEGTGMLFVFPDESNHVFWMKNTLAALDMIFISKDRRIVGILENAEPLTTTPRDPQALSQFVLEVAAGTAFARGFRVGDRVDFQGVPGQ